MALIICPESGKQVSTLAERCPACGCPVSKIQDIDSITTDLGNCNAGNSVANSTKSVTAKVITKRGNKKAFAAILCGIVVIALSIGAYAAFNKLSPEEIQQVQNTYIKIQNIGEITTSSEPRIKKAEESFNALSKKCKRHVKNSESLVAARNQFDSMIAEIVSNQIINIGNVTLEKADIIKRARVDYDSLSESQKGKIKNYSVLELAEMTLNTMQIDNCISLISNIGTVTLDSREKIIEATNAYNTLNDGQKKSVTNYNELQSSNDLYQNLAVDNCMALIDNIGTVSLDSLTAISEAEAAYRKLSPDASKKVLNHDVLKKARSEFNKLKSEKDDLLKKDKFRNIIRVSKVRCSQPNSAGGVSVYINFTNKSSKTIKYAYFTVVPFNAVGDIVESEIGDLTFVNLKATGPYKTNQGLGDEYYWDCVWYNSTITSIELIKVRIEYMDGTSEIIDGADIFDIRY